MPTQEATHSPSLAGRAALAVALLVGFYVVSFGLIALLIYLPYHQYAYGPGVRLYTAAFMLLTAVALLVSIMPTRDRFETPGPLIEEKDAPELFDAIRSLLAATGGEMPRSIYLIPEVNAWVAERGGLLGFGSRRVMGIGLPLLHLLDVSQLRAVLAHELGHFRHGDTALGPWIYRTRAAIRRAIDATDNSLLRAPFVGYGRLFLSITNAVSRRQELEADALASSVAGGGALAEALRIVEVGGPAFDSYWQYDVVPALAAGVRPPLLEGFAQLWARRELDAAVASGAWNDGKVTRNGSHPPLADRLAALEEGRQPDVPPDRRPGLSLLRDPDLWEESLVCTLIDGEAHLELVDWDEIAERVYAPGVRDATADLSPALAEITLATIPYEYESLVQLGSEILGEKGRYDVGATLKEHALGTLETAMLGALLARGWQLRARPGAPLTMVSGDREVSPKATLRALYEGELTIEDWERACADAGIADVPLLTGTG